MEEMHIIYTCLFLVRVAAMLEPIQLLLGEGELPGYFDSPSQDHTEIEREWEC